MKTSIFWHLSPFRDVIRIVDDLPAAVSRIYRKDEQDIKIYEMGFPLGNLNKDVMRDLNISIFLLRLLRYFILFPISTPKY